VVQVLVTALGRDESGQALFDLIQSGWCFSLYESEQVLSDLVYSGWLSHTKKPLLDLTHQKAFTGCVLTDWIASVFVTSSSPTAKK
jgi:hypothetical protein